MRDCSNASLDEGSEASKTGLNFPNRAPVPFMVPVENVVARPVVRIWPVGRQGAIVDTEDLNPFRRALEQAQPSRTAQIRGGMEEGLRVHREPFGRELVEH